MALSIAKIAGPNPAGASMEVIVDITFDSSYPTGGEAVSSDNLKALGLGNIHYFKGEQKGVASRVCEYDYANSKILLFTAVSTEAGSGSDQSAIVVRALVRGDEAF